MSNRLPKGIREALESGARWSPIANRPVTPDEQQYWSALRADRAEVAPYEKPAPDVCPTCGGLGMVRYELPRDHKDYGKLFPCTNPQCATRRAEQAARFDRLTMSAQIPPAYKAFTLDWWAAREKKSIIEGKRDAFGAIRAFLVAADRGFFFTLEEAAQLMGLPAPAIESRGRNSIVLSGANGVGKTSLAVAAGNWLIDNGHGVVYVRMDEALERLRASFDSDSTERESEIMTVYRTAPILIIDELTAAKVTPWQSGIVGNLINHRYTHQLPTLVTTNSGYDEFVDIWGMTMGSRLQAMAHWIVMTGRVLRPRAGEVDSR